MKKTFIEPQLMRIDLKMTENIASSKPDYNHYNGGFLPVIVREFGTACYDFFKESNIPVYGHGLTYWQLADALVKLEINCFADEEAKARAVFTYGL